MKENTKSFWQGFVIGIVSFAVLLIATGATVKSQFERDRQEAISHGAAKWVVNPTNGVVTFQWNK